MKDDLPEVVFEEPYTAADGTMVIPVTRRRWFGDADGKHRKAVGVYVAAEGNAIWVPAVDTNRIALIGVATGLVTAALGAVAVVRRPPWPDLTGTLIVHRTR